MGSGRGPAAACAALALLAVLAAVGVGERVTWPGEPPAPLATAAALLSATGSLWASLALLAAALPAAAYRGRMRDWLILAASLAAATAAAYTLKILVHAPRPTPSYPGYAFPSGHSTRAAVLAAWASGRTGSRAARLAAWAWAAAVAASRLLLHAHWLCDVAAGLLLGYCVERLTERVFNGRA